MKILLLRCGTVFGCVLACLTASAGTEKVTETTTTTTTIVTETVTRETVKWSPFRICVMDFTTADIIGQKRFLDDKNQPIVIPEQCTLNDADRVSIDSVMQGYVRMIDAWDISHTNTANRITQMDDNIFSRTKALELYETVVKGESRPVVIGADYLSARLGSHNDVFSCMDSGLMTAAMVKLSRSPDFPQDFLRELARATGATHLIYGTVSDIRVSGKAFKGYGIETESDLWQMDVIIKMVDLPAQATVYSNVYTGSVREHRSPAGRTFDGNRFQTLMNAALDQAAEDLYELCKPGRKNRITVTVLEEPAAVVEPAAVSEEPASEPAAGEPDESEESNEEE